MKDISRKIIMADKEEKSVDGLPIVKLVKIVKRLDNRYIDMRTLVNQSISRIQSAVRILFR